jgi:RNA polymerase sigma-70 factor (ECF subfamily)
VSHDGSEPSRRERFESQVLVHLDAAYNLARWLLRDAQEAEDVVQEASLRALRFFESQNGPSPKAWFMAIVRNACMDSLTAARRERACEPFDDDTHGSWLLDGAARVDTPETLAARASDARLLHACLAELPVEFREALVLREMEELSYRDIGAIVGVPIGTVMSRLARAREQLARRVHLALKRKSS